MEALLDALSRLLDSSDFVPRAVCGSWTRGEVLLNNISDFLVALAYVSIPVMLVVFGRRRRDIPLSWMSIVFAAFIFSCGATHVLEIVLFYNPVYRLAGIVKAITAVSSWFAVFALYKILPTALSMHSPTELEAAKDELTRGHLQLSNRLSEQNKELAEKNRQLELANDARSRFLANLSHELRTPMVGIIGLSELSLTEDRWDPRDALRKINHAAKSQDSLLADLLEFSTLESGNMKLRPTTFCLGEVFSALEAALHWLAAQRKLKLTFQVDPGLSDTFFWGDGARLRHVLMNLTQNALKFTDEGFVAVEATALGEDRIRFTVTDSGPGIPEDRLEDIFQPFIQVDDSLSKRAAGSGLGLALCVQMLDLMDSRIEVRSCLGEGSSFTFVLRLPPGEAPLASQPHRSRGARILLVEDNPINRKVIEAILSKEGFRVFSAATGLEALEILQRESFDLGLLDLQLPDMDGLSIAAEISRQGIQMPLIALTAHGEKSFRDRALEAGLKDFLVKPVPTDDLVRSIHLALSADGQDPDPKAPG
jgi:signal transduction histidine kinase/CheY-like chemotaxis protein